MTIKAIQEELIEEFAMFDDWMQRYVYDRFRKTILSPLSSASNQTFD